VFLWDKVFL
jgi:UDP-3-O-[3-hydroxymyristoyl] glucosamine N-acyltransferase